MVTTGEVRQRGHTCHRTVALPFDRLAASGDAVFLDLCRSLRLVCTRCGGWTMYVVPLWPDVRKKRAASLGVDTRPATPGTVRGLWTLGPGGVPTA